LSLYIIANVPSDEARVRVLIVIDSLSASISQTAIMTQRINVWHLTRNYFNIILLIFLLILSNNQ